MQLDNDRFLTQYNKAINEYRKRVRRNNMGGWIGMEELQQLYNDGYITSEQLEAYKGKKLPCGCPKPWSFPWHVQCVLNTPLYMVIPPDGVHLSCPAHPEGHHVFGNQVTC